MQLFIPLSASFLRYSPPISLPLATPNALYEQSPKLEDVYDATDDLCRKGSFKEYARPPPVSLTPACALSIALPLSAKH